MHIPDGYLSPQTYGTLYVAMTPIWLTAARRVKASLKTRQVPLLALGAALSFVIMMFNIPIVGGSTGHAVGATVIAIVLGPWAAVIAVSIALIIQALLFGDGGITAIAANCFNMAFLMPFIGYYTYRLIAGDSPSEKRRALAAGVGGYLSLNAAAIATAIMFGIQPLIARSVDGHPLYAPYPLSIAVPAMALEHLLLFGFIEAIATYLIVRYLTRMDAALVEMRPATTSLRLLWAAVGVLVILTPIGMLASGTAWGEWNASELKNMLGFVPTGLSRLEGVWKSLMPGYSFPGITNPMIGYLMTAILGTGIVIGLGWLFGRWLAKGKEHDGPRDSFARKAARDVERVMTDILADEETAKQSGLLQSLDPRAKLISLGVLVLTTSLVHLPTLLAALYALALCLAVASGVRLAPLVRRVWLSAGLLTLVIALPAATAIITPGRVVSALGPLRFSGPGVIAAATLFLRVITSVTLAVLLAMTTRWPQILEGLSSLGVPDIFVMTLGMAQRYAVSLLRTVQQLHLAKESRSIGGFRASAERQWVAGRMAYVVKKSIKLGDDVYDAMLSRGFSGSSRTITLKKFSARDISWLVGTALLSTALLLLNYRMVM